MRPVVVSWEQQHGFPRAQEFAGTLDYTPWLAAPAGVHLLRTLGAERIRAHNADLVDEGQRLVAGAVAALWPRSATAAPAHALLELAQQGRLGDPPVSMRVVPLPPGVAADRAAAIDLRTRLATEHGVEVALDVWRGQGSCACRPRSTTGSRTTTGCAARWRRCAQRLEPNSQRLQQEQRVEIDQPAPQAPVQAGRDRTAGMASIEQAQRCADGDRLSYLDGRGHRFVRGPQPAGVRDTHHAPPGDHACERHGPGPGRAHLLPRQRRPGRPRGAPTATAGAAGRRRAPPAASAPAARSTVELAIASAASTATRPGRA